MNSGYLILNSSVTDAFEKLVEEGGLSEGEEKTFEVDNLFYIFKSAFEANKIVLACFNQKIEQVENRLFSTVDISKSSERYGIIFKYSLSYASISVSSNNKNLGIASIIKM